MRKNICYIISNLNLGGAENTLLKVINGLNNNYNFTVISLTNIGDIGVILRNRGIKVYALEIKNIYSLIKNLLYLYNLIRKLKPDIVHTWMYQADLFGGIISKLAGVKIIYWNIRNSSLISGTSISTRSIGFLNSFFSYLIPNKIILVSENSRIYHSSLGYSNRKMLVIPNGYDVSLYTTNIFIKDKIKKELNISSNSIVIGSIGRYNLYKDHVTFIKSALRVLDIIKKDFNIKFVLIGKNITKENNIIFSLIKNTKFKDNFILLGEQKDIIDYYSLFDIFCLHSISEAFPNVLAEAMCSGLPCISTNVGDVSLMLDDKFCIVPPNNTIKLSNSLIKLINLAKNDLDNIGFQNKLKISSEYSIELFYNNYNQIYNIN